MMLRDAPGGPQLIDHLIKSVKSLALLYANTPDADASAHLETVLANVKPLLDGAVGASKAPIIINGLRRAIMTRKHEIEAAGSLSEFLKLVKE